MEYYNDEYLMHYGVKGMKWGVRRYQNADGSLTDLGKRKASNKDIRSYEKTISKKVNSEFDKRYGEELKTLKSKADKKYDKYAKKHNLIKEEDDAEAFWDDYDKRHTVYDKANDIYAEYETRKHEIRMKKGQEVANRMVDRYGKERMDKFKKSEATKITVAAGVVAAPLIIATLPVTVPLIIATHISEKKSGLYEKEKERINN